MTKRDKLLLGSAAFLAVLVIATAVLVGLSAQSRPKSAAELLLSGGIILLCVLSVVFVFLTKIRRNKYEKKLNPEYYEVYETIRDAVGRFQLPAHSKKEILSDVLDLLLSAQSDGKPVSAAVPDAAAFAENILAVYSSRRSRVLQSLLDGAIAFLLFIVCISAVLWLEDVSAGLFRQRIDYGMLIFLAVVSFVLVPVLRYLMLRRSAWLYILPILTGIVFVAAAELARRFFYQFEFTRTLLDGSVVMIPGAAALAFYLLVVAVLMLAKAFIRKQALRA